METLTSSLLYALGIIGVTGLLIFLLALVYQILRFIDRRLPRIWLVIGPIMVVAGIAIEYFRLTAVSLLVCTAGLLLMTIGGLLWWLERRDATDKGEDQYTSRRVAPRL
jgi:hypothetical protein